MIHVCVFYVVTWMPVNVYHVAVIIDAKLTLLDSRYYAVLFVAFIYLCANPLIYAAKFDPVKRVLLSSIPCKKNRPQPAGNHVQCDENGGTRTVTVRAVSTKLEREFYGHFAD